MRPLYIVGAGGLGKEVKALVQQINDQSPAYMLKGFIDDHIAAGTSVNGLEVKGDINFLNALTEETSVVIAIGDPKVKEAIFQKISNRKLSYPVLIHPAALLMEKERIKIGEGSIITAGSIFTTDIEIGKHVLVNLSCTIGHDVIVQDFSSIMPATSLSGNVKIGKGVYMGTGVKCINALSIGDHSIIGAGAVVIDHIPSRVTAVGVPARITENH